MFGEGVDLLLVELRELGDYLRREIGREIGRGIGLSRKD